MSDPILSPERQPEDQDRALRPQVLDDFVGQAEARANLRVFIASLRKKIEADPLRPRLIKTETGVGYRLVPDPEKR